MFHRTCITATLVTLLVTGAVATAADAPVAADKFELSRKNVRFYPDGDEKPIKPYVKRSRDSFEFSGATLVKYDKSSRMFLLHFADGESGWLATSDFVPLDDDMICNRPSRSASLALKPASGDSNTAGVIGLGEEICP